MRNMWPSYKGGAWSRAGTKFVGYSKQTGRNYPPRLITFQFSLTQGLALEFGNFYMRVIFDGAQVTETPLAIFAASQANPCVITVATLDVTAAVANNAATVVSYETGDFITIAGGSYITPAVLQVTGTQAISLAPVTAGTAYVPGDNITMDGGTHSVSAIATVTHTLVVNITIGVAGTGGANGARIATGTTGTGTKFRVNVTVAGGAITAIGSIIVEGDYTVNPTIAAEPVSVTGGGLADARLVLVMGVKTVSVANAGVYTVNPVGSTFTQASTTGAGTGATFFAVMGVNTLSVSDPGVYTVAPTNPASQASTTGSGLGATYTLTSAAGGAAFNTGDWISIVGVVGMTELNGGTYVVTRLTASTYALRDIYGNTINSTAFTAYASGGTAARIYTLTTPWAEADLKWLKYSQSKNIMNLTCVNQDTGTEYEVRKLTRNADDDWSIAVLNTGSSIDAPASGSGETTAAGDVNYAYVVTAVDATTGSESVASPIIKINSAVDITATAGSIVISWASVSGTAYYNAYKAPPGYKTPVAAGALYGFAGSAYGNRLVDRNIVADLAQVPPLHRNPFARGQLLKVDVVSSTTDWTTCVVTISTSTGSGAVLEAIIDTDPLTSAAGAIVSVIVKNPGHDYAPGDFAVFTGDGTGATGAVSVGPRTGTYPGTSAYFQQRFALANTLNNPDTYFMSQVGAFDNFDARLPTIASDAIIGSPWSTQVNGIQWMIPVAGGLLVMTGLGAWVLAGSGSFATNVQPISPTTQDAIPQAFTGVSGTVVPQKINYDVLYVESKGSLFYDQPYQLYALSEPLDLTENSTHLFRGFTIRDNAWCEQPNKLLWATRSDGVLLSLTWLKAQQVQGWARHDTNGYFWSVCPVTEPPVDALYLASQRFPPQAGATYMLERMDNRTWTDAEECWCVDSALSLSQPKPAASLVASSATGLGAVSGYTGLVGGSGWSAATTVSVVDDNGLGTGSGASYTPVIVAGVITALTKVSGGVGYSYPRFDFYDPENLGSGASAVAVLDNSATFTADVTLPPIFVVGDVGKIIRMGGGIARITGYTSGSIVTANILSPIVNFIPNTGAPAPALSGQWTMTRPITRIGGLRHLAGLSVTGLADGNVVTSRLVDVDGFVTLDTAASAVTLGLGYTAQLQSIYLDAGEPTVQGQRKKIAEATLRLEASRDVQGGANQTDGSTLSPPRLAPTWGLGGTLENFPNKARKPYNALCEPLFTEDSRAPLLGGFNVKGQIAIQQSNPLPVQVLATVDEALSGDLPELKAYPRRGSRDNG